MNQLRWLFLSSFCILSFVFVFYCDISYRSYLYIFEKTIILYLSLGLKSSKNWIIFYLKKCWEGVPSQPCFEVLFECIVQYRWNALSISWDVSFLCDFFTLNCDCYPKWGNFDVDTTFFFDAFTYSPRSLFFPTVNWNWKLLIFFGNVRIIVTSVFFGVAKWFSVLPSFKSLIVHNVFVYVIIFKWFYIKNILNVKTKIKELDYILASSFFDLVISISVFAVSLRGPGVHRALFVERS